MKIEFYFDIGEMRRRCYEKVRNWYYKLERELQDKIQYVRETLDHGLIVVKAYWIEFVKYFFKMYMEWCPILKAHSLVPLSIEDYVMDDFNEIPNWKKAKVRAIAIHPDKHFMALIVKNQGVSIFWSVEEVEELILKWKNKICSIAFRPCVNVELAVGYAGQGVCLLHEEYPKWKKVWLQGNNFYKDIVTQMQWSQDGSYLVCALQLHSCLEIWSPETRSLLKTLPMPGMDSNLWLLRHPMGMDHLFDWFSGGNGLRTGSLIQWEYGLTHHQALQTATWSGCGKHFFYVPKGSSHLYMNSPYLLYADDSVVWDNYLLADLRCKFPHAIAVDPMNRYMAIMFKGKRHVMLCELDLSRYSVLPWKLVGFIKHECNPRKHAYPMCIRFTSAAYMEGGALIIAWSNGKLQYNPLDRIVEHLFSIKSFNLPAGSFPG